MDKYRKYDTEAIRRIQEKHRKEREEFDRKEAEKELALEVNDSSQKVDPTYAPDSPSPTRLELEEKTEDFLADNPQSPVYTSNSWDDEPEPMADLAEKNPDNPTYAPDSPSPTRLELEEINKEQEKEETSSDEESSDDEIDDPSSEIIQSETLDNKSISQHRKAYVKWVNEDFYLRLKKLKPQSSLKIYQLLVQQYLATNMPYRGLLVYHGLGTGKTATAISLGEGLSGQMKINTLLPASLEGNFIDEIVGDPVIGKMGFGTDELDINNLWTFTELKDIDDDFKDKYNLDGKSLRKIQNMTVKELNKKHNKDISKKGKLIKGFFIPDKNGKEYNKFSIEEMEFIKQQIKYLIIQKYNFIHYNPFPKVKSSSIKEFQEDEDDDDEEEFNNLLLTDKELKEINTNNKRIVKDLEKRLKYNIKNFNIKSPFYGECLIIDEVHNFVREILNPGSKPSKVFYDWIVNAENIKLIFLSGTPIINKPSEIAVLYNMLKGLIKIYTFTIKTDINDTEMITNKLNEFYYSKSSIIELFYVKKEKGKIVISFIQEKSGFESVMDKDNNIIYTIQSNKEGIQSFDKFMNQIFKGLHNIFSEDDILPTKSTIDDLSLKDKTKLLRGEIIIYDDILNIPFNKYQKLFDIYDDNKLIDTTNNDNFMKYFFENKSYIPEKKRILLKRMLMGLTSYYPIDRTSIVDMPIIKEPEIIQEKFKDYKISQNINIVSCMMSKDQFEKYSEMWSKEKDLDMLRKLNEWNDDNSVWHYHMRTRQTCNIIFQDDDFRTIKKVKDNPDSNEEIDDLKYKSYQSILDNQSLKIDKELKYLSPKMNQIMNNIQKFINDKNNPTGKILFYSDFRSDGGSEAFELVLKCNGYEKFNSDNPQTDKGKRYTFITGSEGSEERNINKEYYNNETNKYGEYIQIMIISSAGAEGISLKGVRQVHILEPFWNYVRIDQVLGRAIRMKSHDQLPKEERNVEQYLYLSTLPEGHNLETVYQSLKNDSNDTWKVPIFDDDKILSELSKIDNRETKDMIDMIIKINNDSNGTSSDIKLFNIMENKYKISLEINSVIKESSLDCIQHTRDDPELNEKCIRFSDKLSGEIAYFPGIDAKILENIDIIQLKANYIFHIKPNLYVISASNEDKKNLFIYYEYSSDEKNKDKIDIRYLRENGKRLCDIYLDTKMILNYSPIDHPHNKKLGKEFSVYQEIYLLDDSIINEYINEDKFPSLDKILLQDNLHGYKLKYNINNTFYYMGINSILPDKSIKRIYPYVLYEKENYNIHSIKPRVIYNGEIYIQN
jgi:hypothetical protein